MLTHTNTHTHRHRKDPFTIIINADINYFGTDIVNYVCIPKQYRFVLLLEEFDML